jgi:hypothetical protein
MSTLSTTNLKNPSSGSNNIVLGADGTVTVGTITGTSVRGGITSGTAVASTSGTSIDFTGIPSWVKRVTVMFSGVSTNGTSAFQVQLGTSSGIETTGYNATTGVVAGAYVGAAGTATATTGFVLEYNNQVAAALMSGHLLLTTISSNTWVASGIIGSSSTSQVYLFSGNKATASTLDRVRITTVNGTDTFDAGSINILYEG